MRLEVSGPIRLVSESNAREHWAKRHLRKKQQQADAYFLLLSAPNARQVRACGPPYRVTLTRIGRKYDPGNNEISFKHVQDLVAQWLGVDDGDESRVSWKYEQEKGPVGLRIVIEAGGEP